MDRLPLDSLFSRDIDILPVRAHSARLVSDQLRALWRRRAIVLSTTILGLAVGISALHVMPKKFTSEAILQLDFATRENAQAAGQSSPVVVEGTSIVQSEVRILRSRAIAHRVVERLHLADAASGPIHAGPIQVLIQLAHQAAMRLGIAATDPPEQKTARTELAEAALMEATKAEADARSYLISVAYTADQPERAALIANTIVDEYVQRRLEANYDAANKMSDWLSTQLKTATTDLQTARTKVDEFRERNGLLEALGGGESVGQQQLRTLTEQLSAAALERMNAEARLGRVTELVHSGVMPSAADLQGSPIVQRLLDQEAAANRTVSETMGKVGSGHPALAQAKTALGAIRAVITTELGKSLTVLASNVATVRRTEDDLRAQLGRLETSMIAKRGKETELRALETAAQMANDRVTSLMHSFQQTLALRDLRPVAAVLVGPAEPNRIPISPKPLIVLPLSIMAGLLGGILIAVMLESGDRGVRSSAEVKSWSHIRSLGMVPEMARPGASSRRQQATQAIFDESIRSVGAALNLFGPKQDCRVVLVTSSVPGEGKSTLCNALGSALAASGRRVLIVDGTPNRRKAPGLTADITASGDAPRPTSPDDQPPGPTGNALTVLKRSSQGKLADVFGSSQFDYWLNEARKHFDLILLEGPPVAILSDSLVLGRPADAVIYVIRWAATKQKVVEAALERLRDCSVVVDGLVLSRVDLHRHATFGFIDQCSNYWKERRLITRLTGRAEASAPDVSRAA